ncbi:MAG: type III pantothenate kinase [Bacteroidota bacterium]
MNKMPFEVPPKLRRWPNLMDTLMEDGSDGFSYLAQCDALAIDAGNSRIKAGWFSGQRLIEVWHIPVPEFGAGALPALPKRTVLCSVGYPEEHLKNWLIQRGLSSIQVIRKEDPLPFKTQYSTPETLGSDRKMLVHGANVLRPGIPRLVVSLGTCITYDWIGPDQVHQGGYISPGLPMRWSSMHQYTGRLPLVSHPDIDAGANIPAKNTEAALQWGVVEGVRHEIRGFWQSFLHQNDPSSKAQLILTGGDAHFFEISPEERIFAAPNLALIGLHAML